MVALVSASSLAAASREVALSYDDLPDLTAGDDPVEVQSAITERLVSAIAREHAPVIGFVNEDKLIGSDGQKPDPRRVALLARWVESGFEIGNHTLSHVDLNEVPLADFEDDVLQGDRITRPLLASHGQRLVWFRHPYLDTGRTAAERDAANAFLASHGYRVAPVTIDDSEWIYDLAYRAAHAWQRPIIRRSYVRYMERRFAFAEEKSRRVFGREIPQIVLLHASALNGAAFPLLARMIRGRGYRFISIETAVADPAYRSADGWVGGGVGWIERWGTTRGIPQREFDSDPKVPPWIQRLAGEKDE